MFVEERERRTCYCHRDDSPQFFLERRMGFGKRAGATGPRPAPSEGSSGNRKLPPIHFLIGWGQTTKELCFFLHGNKLMQSRCSETQSEGQRCCLASRSRAAFHLSAAGARSALPQTTASAGTAGVGTFCAN